MNSKVKDIDIKKRTYYFFNDVISTKHFDPDKYKIISRIFSFTKFHM